MAINFELIHNMTSSAADHATDNIHALVTEFGDKYGWDHVVRYEVSFRIAQIRQEGVNDALETAMVALRDALQ